MIECKLVEGVGEDDPQGVHSGAFHQDRDREKELGPEGRYKMPSSVLDI